MKNYFEWFSESPFLPCKIVGAVPFMVAVGDEMYRMSNVCRAPEPSQHPLLLGTLFSK